MLSLDEIQKEIFQNKINRGFNVTDVGKEIILMTEELGELARAYRDSNKKIAKDIDNKDALVALVRKAGFGDVEIHTNASAMNCTEDVGCMNHRLVISARKQ